MPKQIDTMVKQLQNHIQNFENHFIVEWLEQAEQQFNAKLVDTPDGGLKLLKNNSKYSIGATYYGKTKAIRMLIMFYTFIDRRYGYIDSNNRFVANLGFMYNSQKPIF